MASPISPGEVLKIAKGVYKLYKRFKHAPKEMKQLGEQVRLVTALLHHSDDAIMHLDFLKTPEGRNLLDILHAHLREMKKILRRAKDVAKQWHKVQENFWRKAPFIFYTMRAIPGLRSDLEFELNLVETVKTQAFQIGVPAALKQMEAKLAAQNKQRKAEAQDEFTASELKRRAAYAALKKSSTMKQPATAAEKRDQTLSTLRQSGLADDEAKKLLDLHEKELKEAANKPPTKNANPSAKAKKPEPKKQQGQNDKSTPKGSDKPKIVVIKPQPNNAQHATKEVKPNATSSPAKKDSIATERKPNTNQDASKQAGSRPKSPNLKPSDAEAKNSTQAGSNTSTPKRSNSPANDNQKTQNNKTTPENKQTKEPEKGKTPAKPNDNKKAEGEKNANKQAATKQNQPKNLPAPSEASAKRSKSPAQAKKANGTSEGAGTQANQPQSKPTKQEDKKKQSNTNLLLNNINETIAEMKKAEKQKAQKETATNQAKAQSPNRGQTQQKRANENKGTAKAQPVAAAV